MLLYLQMIESESDWSKFESVYMTYRALMYYIAFEILKNEMDAEDAVHQAFVKLAENIDKIDEPVCAKTKAYVAIIAERKALDIYRKRTRSKEVPFTEETAGVHIEYTDANSLGRCLAMLQSNYRQCILLRYVYGYTTKELGKIMNISEANAAKLLQRAKGKLEKLCKDEGVL